MPEIFWGPRFRPALVAVSLAAGLALALLLTL